MTDVPLRARSIVARYLDVPIEKIAQNSDFKEDLGADSLEIVEMVIAFEEEFGLEIDDEAIDEISTVGDVIRLLERAA